MALCNSLDKVGPICRSVEDTAIVLEALSGADIDDRSSLDAPFVFDAMHGNTGLRVGYLSEAFGDGATAVDHAALDALRGLGLSVTEVTLPDLPYGALMNIVYAEAAGRGFTVPQGFSLWGRLFDEGPILSLGMALERALGVAERRPGFPK